MIVMTQSLPVGNAIRLFLRPPTGATYWRVLRKVSDTFTGPGDTGAVLVYEGDDSSFVDRKGLVNTQGVFYRPYYHLDDGSWVAGASVGSTPAATYEDQYTDAMSLLQERLDLGLRVEVERGTLLAESGKIPVFSAPPVVDNNLRFPVVTLSLDMERPSQRGLGEMLDGDEYDQATGEWFDTEGWLADVRISVTAWTLNADERRELRKALRRIIIANLPVFDADGLIQIELELQDRDYLDGEFDAPMFQVTGTFTCIAPVRVGRTYNEQQVVNDIELTVNGLAAVPAPVAPRVNFYWAPDFPLGEDGPAVLFKDNGGGLLDVVFRNCPGV